MGAKTKYLETIFKFGGEISANLKQTFDTLETNMEKTQAKFSKLSRVGEGFSKVGNALTLGITAPVAAMGVAGVKGAMEFKGGMQQVNTMLKLQEEELKKVSDQARNFSDDYRISIDKVTNAMYQGLSAGVKQEDLFKTLGVAAKASKGGFTDLTIAIDGITNTINSYGLSMDKAEDIANQMLITQNLGKTTFGELAVNMSKVTPIARQMGVGTKELFSQMAVLTANGINTSEAVTGLKATLSNIVKPSKQASDMAESLGFSFDVSTVKSKGLMGTIQYLTDNLANLSPEYAKLRSEQQQVYAQMTELEKAGKQTSSEYKQLETTFMNYSEQIKILSSSEDAAIDKFAQMFGSVEALNTVMVLGSGSGMDLFNKSMQEMKTNTTALDDAFKTMQEAPLDKLEGTVNKMKNTLSSIGEKALPIVDKALDGVNNLLDKFNNLSPKTQDMIIKIALAGAMAGPAFKIFGTGLKGISKAGQAVNKLTTVVKAMKAVKTSGMAVAATSKVATLGLGTLGGAAIGLTAGLGALGVGIALVNKRTKSQTKSLDLLKAHLGDDAEKVREFSGRIDELGRKMNAVSSMDVNLSAEAKATFLGEVELIVSDVQNQIDKKLQEDLKRAEELGLSEEQKATLKTKAETEKADVTKISEEINKIMQSAVEEGRSLVQTESENINKLLQQLEKSYMVGQGISAKDTESYQQAKANKENVRSEDLAKVVKEINTIAENERKLAFDRQQRAIQDAQLMEQAGAITKEQMQAQMDMANQLFEQSMQTIAQRRGEEMVSLYEEFGKTMDYVNIETGELKSGFTNFFHTLGLAVNTQKNEMYTMYADINKVTDESMRRYMESNLKYEQMGVLASQQTDKMLQDTNMVKAKVDETSPSMQNMSTSVDNLGNSAVIATNKIQNAVSSINSMTIKAPTVVGGVATPQPQTQNLPKFAKGGIATRPSIFGEAGPEIAIPLNNTERSHGLLRMANKMLGGVSPNNSNVNINYTVNITGNANPKEIQNTLANDKAQLLKMFEEYEQNKRRVSLA